MIRNVLFRFILSATAFAVGVVGVMGVSAAVAASGNDRSGPVVTPDKSQAEQEAGYGIVTPVNLPEGMTLQAYIVDGIKRNNKSDAVDQYWHVVTEEGAKQWISVMQGPRAAGLINGSAATFAGVDGQKVRHEVEDGRDYPVVELMWPHDGGFLYVAGNIVGTQTEDTLVEVARSLISR